MKKKIQSFAILLFLGFSLRAVASAPCHTAFAVDVAFIERDYATDLADCGDYLILEGPCKEEAALKRAYSINNALNTWSQCCCTYGLSCCG